MTGVSRRSALLLAAGLPFAVAATGSARAAGNIRIAMLVKSLGNGFFDACHQGGEEAAKQIGGIELIYTGPTAPTAEGQIELINSLIAQKVDAIAISANDPNALVPIAKRAMSRGIKVLSFDSGIAPGGRLLHLNPSNNQLIGEKLVQMTADAAGGSGEFAVLSATAQATNQNIWIAEVKKVLARPDYANLKLVSTVYGDDQPDKSYREALGLFKSYPNLKVITAPTTVGIAAAAKAVEDENLVGKVYVTGLGLPSEMKGHVESGATKTFAIWNPIDLGYTVTYLAYRLVKGEATGKPGEAIDAGRMGKIEIGANSEAAMSPPYSFDKSNIDRFAKMF